MPKTYRLGVIGNPIKHSLSPTIHQQFAQQFDLDIDYQKYLVEEEQLEQFVADFFSRGGEGLNATLPHKQALISVVDELTDEAQAAGSVNTLFLNRQGDLIGHTTDGSGLIYDFDRLGWQLKGKRVLVVGAGGASQSILLAILKQGAVVELLNRTHTKVEQLANQFKSFGTIEEYSDANRYDLVISSISEFNHELLAPVAAQIGENTLCYDLNYGTRAEQFTTWCQQAGAKQIVDGMGMLIGQAAKSFHLWVGKLPNIEEVELP